MRLTELLLTAATVAALVGITGLVVLWWHARRTGFGSLLGRGTRIVASDVGAAPRELLRDAALGLRGQPDYLVESRVGTRVLMIPIEVKPTRQATEPYESDKVQMGAYVILTRATYGDQSAPFGFLRYARRWFRIDLTPELERHVRAIVHAIRVARVAAVVHRSHDIPARCVGCPVRSRCDERLA